MKVLISTIKGLDSYRKDPGDCKELAHSIKGSGLIQPVILLKRQLISGSRRITACQINGEAWIDAVVCKDLLAVMDALEAERHDTLHSLVMRPSERVRFWRVMEKLRDGKRIVGLNMRDRVAEHLGISTMTLWRMSAIFDARYHPQSTPEVVDLYNTMETSGRVGNSYTQLRALKDSPFPNREEPSVTALHSQRRILSGACDKALALATALPQIKDPHRMLTQEEIAQNIADFVLGRRALEQAIKTLRGAQTT